MKQVNRTWKTSKAVKPRESARGSDEVFSGVPDGVAWWNWERRVDSCWVPWTQPDPRRCWHTDRRPWRAVFRVTRRRDPGRLKHRHSSTTRSRAGSSSEEVSLASDWILGAGVAAEAAGDWSSLVPVSQIYLTTERSRQSRFAQCQRGSSEHKRLYSQGSATCRRGSSGRNLSRQESRA